MVIKCTQLCQHLHACACEWIVIVQSSFSLKRLSFPLATRSLLWRKSYNQSHHFQIILLRLVLRAILQFVSRLSLFDPRSHNAMGTDLLNKCSQVNRSEGFYVLNSIYSGLHVQHRSFISRHEQINLKVESPTKHFHKRLHDLNGLTIEGLLHYLIFTHPQWATFIKSNQWITPVFYHVMEKCQYITTVMLQLVEAIIRSKAYNNIFDFY